MSKQPFLPLFFGDFLASTAEWSGEAASLYLTLLGHQWTLGTLPTDPSKLARLVRWERKAFDRCWPTVSEKFLERDGRLVNDRLEQHRAKSEELAEKNRTSGRKGAEARWRKDGERHSAPMANAIEAPCHLSHPIPSHPEAVVTSPPETHVSAHLARASAREKPDTFTLITEIRSVYPAGIYRQADWVQAERALHGLLDSGEPSETLIAAAVNYAAQQQAKGSVGTQFVMNPAKFYASENWRGPFPLPAAQSAPVRESDYDRMTRAIKSRAGEVFEHDQKPIALPR